ncbi:DNA repair family protein [Apiospora rasikravindrae]|uniref:DNA repair family protein n=1 Tax=Apiospora rasikravindrae TaxID=990691 RepID=A0ABR1T6T4_9PEZI
MSRKRTIDAFFGAAGAGAPKPKKPRDICTGSPETFPGDAYLDGLNTSANSKELETVPPPDAQSAAKDIDISQIAPGTAARKSEDYSTHPAYPFPIPHLPPALAAELPSWPASLGRAINDQPDLDLLYFEPYVARGGGSARSLFEFLRSELPFYRVEYDINRGGTSTHIRTPRWTTVFGLDDTSRFSSSGGEEDMTRILDVKTGRDVSADKFYARYKPRPIPKCLDDLRLSAQEASGCEFNFCLVNYYASGADSISFHSDDERFLGPLPAIASFSLGARREFLLKHKPIPPPPGGEHTEAMKNATSKPLKLPLASGDMILMRGPTQANWLHSIPKRTGKNATDGGRINITFRRALVKLGTDNYYNYNVGTGPVYKWDAVSREMRPWKKNL